MDDQAAAPLFEFRRVYVDGTMRLARQAAENGIKRFIFLSSIKVNGEATQLGHPFLTDQPQTPEDPCGISKMEAEEGVCVLACETSMGVVMILPPLVFGSGVKANFLSMMRWLMRGIPLLQIGAVLLSKRDMAQRFCGSLEADLSKLRELLGWTPPVSVDQGH